MKPKKNYSAFACRSKQNKFDLMQMTYSFGLNKESAIIIGNEMVIHCEREHQNIA